MLLVTCLLEGEASKKHPELHRKKNKLKKFRFRKMFRAQQWVHFFNLITKEAEADLCEFEVSLPSNFGLNKETQSQKTKTKQKT